MTIINLTDTDTHSFADENLIQKKAQTDFNAKISEYLQQIDQLSKTTPCSGDFRRSHNTILINGKRGMGKSSFILSIINQKKSEWQSDVCVLDIVDPTMIETKEHIFLNILSLIQNMVEKQHKDTACRNESCYTQCKDSLKRLAQGLNVLDGVGGDHLKEALWDSPELILEKGLANAKQGGRLEKNFHVYIDNCLRFLEKKAFLLVFDDIDTSLNEGKTVLETLRKYLTSPKLILTLLGDIDLYSTIVRQLQWEKLDANGTLKKYEETSKFINQIEHLEEQYLTKLLKPENRITLRTLFELEKGIKLQSFADEDAEGLVSYMEDLIDKVFYISKESQYSKLYQRVLLTQSIRSVIQVLKALDRKTPVNKTNSEQQMKLVESLYQVFFTTLKRKLEAFGLLVPTDEFGLPKLTRYMLEKGINKDSGIKLLPNLHDADENVALAYLNALVNAQLNPRQYLSYFVQVGYAVEQFTTLRIKETSSLESFWGHVGLNEANSNFKLAKKLLTTFHIHTNTHTTKPVFFGNFSVNRDDLSKLNDTQNLSLFLSRVYNPKGGQYNFLSLFNLIGFLADISTAENAEESFLKVNLIRSFYLYADSETPFVDHEAIMHFQNEDERYVVSDKLKNELLDWTKKANDINQRLSLADLGKMWTRVVYSFTEIDSRSENKGKTYNEMLNLYIAAFLNAIYIHCEQKKGKVVDIKNPATEPKKGFYNKLKAYVSDSGTVYTLFDYLYECPALKEGVLNLPNSLKTELASNKKQDNKKDFKKLDAAKQKEAISNIQGWQGYQPITIQNKLRDSGYKNVPSKLDSLLESLKNNQ